MARVYDLLIRARGDTKDADRAMRQLQRNIRQTGRRISSVGKGMTLGLTLPVMAFGKLAYDEFTSAQQANAQTAAALKSTGGVARVTAGHISKLSTSILAMSGIDDQAAQSAQNLLLTFTGIRNEAGRGNRIFDQTTLAIMDMATAMNQGAVPSAEQLKTTTLQVGKALNDPIKGMTALRKVGVSFTKDQQAQVKQLVESGKTMQAQKFILRELNKEFGGSAKAAGKTLPAQLARLRESFAGVGAELLSTLMPQINDMLGKVQGLANWFGSLSPTTQKWAARLMVLGAVLGPVLIAVGSLVAASAALMPVLVALTGPIGLVVAGAVALGLAFVALWRKSDTFRRIFTASFIKVRVAVAAVLGELRKTLGVWGGWAVAFWQRHGASIRRIVGAAFRGVLRVVGPSLQTIKSVIIAVMRVLRGDWSGAWQAMRQAVSSAFAAIRVVVSSQVRLVVGLLRKTFKPAWDVFTSGLDKAQELAGKLADKMKPIGSALRTVGGWGKKAGRALSGIFGDGDLGATVGGYARAKSSTLKRWGLVKSMGSAVGLGSAMGLAVSSGIRRGAITSTGNPSDHATGHAADFVGSPLQMMAFARAADRLAGVKQVIYSPLGWARDGGAFSPIPRNVGTVWKDHFNHVHVAMHALGGIFNRPHLGVVAEAGPEAIIPLNGSRRSMGLYAQAGRALGVGSGGNTYNVVVNANDQRVDSVAFMRSLGIAASMGMV